MCCVKLTLFLDLTEEKLSRWHERGNTKISPICWRQGHQASGRFAAAKSAQGMPMSDNLSMCQSVSPELLAFAALGTLVLIYPLEVLNTINLEIMKAFKLFDVNGDGVVTATELKNVLKKLGGNVSDKDIGDMIGSADDDGNEEVDYREFEKLWDIIRGDSEVKYHFCIKGKI